jgi:putative ABC transport system ATP-binding protein
VHVLRGLDLTVRRGEFLAVMGPSGCGKSTLLHVLGMMTPTDTDAGGRPMGSIILDGEETPNVEAVRSGIRRAKIGFVFQRFNLLNVLTAADNVAISLRVRGLRTDGRVKELFEAMGVWHVAGRKPGQMSIGEQQRVAVVRALAHRPAMLLADEPTGNLDSDSAAALLELFRRMNRQEGQTTIMITHSAEAASYADRVVRMKDGKIGA